MTASSFHATRPLAPGDTVTRDAFALGTSVTVTAVGREAFLGVLDGDDFEQSFRIDQGWRVVR